MKTKLEKLQLIKTKCQELLSIAEKRTPGQWENSDNVVFAAATDGYYMITCDGRRTTMSQDARNAAYIASCAGPAEAGWRATIAAIDSCIADDERYQEMYNLVNLTMIEQIIAAWEGLI